MNDTNKKKAAKPINTVQINGWKSAEIQLIRNIFMFAEAFKIQNNIGYQLIVTTKINKYVSLSSAASFHFSWCDDYYH